MTDESLMQTLKPTVWIGKKGCTPEAVAEIRRQLEGRKPVKVRFLRGAGMDPEELSAKTGGEVLGVRGRTMVLQRKKTAAGHGKSGPARSGD
jgi:RNA-binding protein